MSYNFTNRHIGSKQSEINEMLAKCGVQSIEELINQTIPSNIRLKKDINIPEALSENEYLEHIEALGKKNKVFRTYIGMGYYNNILPSVIKRNIFENPGWYTAYTPYQAEISQGRLAALLNFQTMVVDLTGLELANASLLDEGTAASEAMLMFFHNRSKTAKQNDAKKFFVSDNMFPQTIDVLKTRAEPMEIELVFGDHRKIELDQSYFGAIVQYPAACGEIYDYSEFAEKVHAIDAYLAVAADLMSLAILKPPGEWGADCVVGTTQQFGIPLGYGGPHAAYFATHDEFKRNIPGRIIGVTQDADGNRALRMALQTREQHIKRDRATSNICTAQVLLAVMAGMYAVFHGPDEIKEIAENIHSRAGVISKSLKEAGFTQQNDCFFDTLRFAFGEAEINKIKQTAAAAEINFFYGKNYVQLSLDETTTDKDVQDIINVFAKALGKNIAAQKSENTGIPSALKRRSDFMTHPVFNTTHSETQMMRYIKQLENKDFSLVHGMIPLGSCTMKLNAASELIPLSSAEWGNIHPFVPLNQAAGYAEVINNLSKYLCEITGFEAISLQPNSGAQGEYAGLMVIRAFHAANGDTQRNVAIIPSSAHGTNPASAVMAGMKVVVVKCDDNGNIDVEDLRSKAAENAANLAALMVTYPSTHGVFEESIVEITDIIHKNGGQVYMDGANMNAQVGLTNPANIGADVCHLNLHKTFAIPHGGGGPGMGPIGVAKHLAPFLPGNPMIKTGGEKAITAVSAAPWGSALILLISYAYIKMLGLKGVKAATENAILNANYLKECLKDSYDSLYTNQNGRVAHEMIIDCRSFKSAGVEVVDIAKRLMDYGFHAPTVSFPVHGTLMVEPTESEDKGELDRFVMAMESIKKEIDEIAGGEADEKNNVLKNAPHTFATIISDNWEFPYSRAKAVFPLAENGNKYWPTVRRVDEAYGDRNLVCSCLPIAAYA